MSVTEKLLSGGEKLMDLETIQCFVVCGFFSGSVEFFKKKP